jgi:Ca2+/Na+ antiporter
MVSYAKALLLFYILLIGSSATNLIGTQLGDFIRDNRYFQHVVGYVTMMTLLSEFSGVDEPKKLLFMTTLLYAWFILTTKLEVQWNLAILLLLVLAYLYENHLETKEKSLIEDQAADNDDLNRVVSQDDRIKYFITISIGVITIIGTILYLQRKRVQYGGDFDLERYLLEGRNN